MGIKAIFFCSVVLAAAGISAAYGQMITQGENSPRSEIASPAREIFYDSDGNRITNNEFVDIRTANFHIKDATLTRRLEDGTVEFRLQKVPQEGMPVPDFTIRTIDGKTITSADLKGKVAVLNFWFIGCPVCRSIKPGLNSLRAKFAGDDRVVFIALSPDDASSIRKYIEKEHFDYLQAAEAAGVMRLFNFGGYPKNIVIDKTGRIVYWRSNITAWDKFESVILSELAR